jgi:3-oxoadipyl-CoA thiolase
VPRAVILSAVRTPVGRRDGALAHVRPDDLAAVAIEAAVARAGVPAAEIEDVWFGCANQAGEDNRNVARMAALLAGLPESVAGVTVNRLCASGLAAIVGACHAVGAGDGDLFVAGGVESMSRAPFAHARPEYGDGTEWDTQLGWRFPNPKLEAMFPLESMGETGENVAERWNISREDQDAFAAESQRRAASAIQSGAFKDEIVPVIVPGRKGETRIDTDEHPRPGTTAESLAKLKPAFKKDGSVTAGNASGINDGAAALVVASAERAQRLGLTPMARILSHASAAVDPRVMGIGPVPAVRKALEKASLGADAIDLFELNEAFAAQSLAVLRELGLDSQKVNVLGGAIALGHPIGASGARIRVTLRHALRARRQRHGVAALCIGGGQGVAMVVERL